MSTQVTTFKSAHFQNDVNALSFKDNNFTFKRTRSLAIMIAENNDYSHIVKLEKVGFDKPLFSVKIKGDLRVIFTLEKAESSLNFTLTFLRAVVLDQLAEAVETLDTEEAYSAFNFKDFWT
jgi:mRNA-degrading endonuclease YafQ of YafQ-DinJ toxin-antitoxin module